MDQNTRNLEKRLAAYGSMSLALAAVSMPPAARADTIAWTADVTTAINTPLYFDITDGVFGTTPHLPDFELFTSVAGSAIQALLFAKGQGFQASSVNNNAFALTGSSVARLSPGVPIGPGMSFNTFFRTLASNAPAPSTPFGHWNDRPASGDVGLAIVRSGQTYYGWANIVVNQDYTVTLNTFGYNTAPGQSVIDNQGVAPEPASILLMALGAAGIAAYRRKRNR